MLNEFKNLNSSKKVIVGLIALLILPITLLLLSGEFLVKSIKDRKIPKAIIAGVLCVLFVAPSLDYISKVLTSDSTSTNKVASLESEITSLENKISSKDDEIKSLKAKLNSSNEEVSTLESKVSSLEDKIASTEKDSEDATDSTTDSNDSSDNTTTSSDNSSSSSTSNNSNISSNYSSNNSSSYTSKNSSSYSGNSSSSYSGSSSSSYGSSEIVYCNGGRSKSNKYHKTPTAHNMEGAIRMTRQQAEAAGYVACKRCY
ncbi:MAG: hypothetical protein E7A06_07290 [Clostridiales bacterium]|nr:hypothetical protein [Clostridiales bacterium]